MAGTMNVFFSSRGSAASPIFPGGGSSGCPDSHLHMVWPRRGGGPGEGWGGQGRRAQTIRAGARPPGRRRGRRRSAVRAASLPPPAGAAAAAAAPGHRNVAAPRPSVRPSARPPRAPPGPTPRERACERGRLLFVSV